MALSLRWIAAAAVAFLVNPAAAVDGCKVILCLAGPWRSIPDCVPDVRKALRHGIPNCNQATDGNNTTYHSWASAADCPPQYTVWEYDLYGNRTAVGCNAAGVVNVMQAGVPYVRVWWFPDGETTSTWYSAAARLQYGSLMDPRYDLDFFAWQATQPPPGTVPSGSDQYGNQ